MRQRFAFGASLRKYYWASRSLFEEYIKKSPVFKSLDPRVVNLYVEFSVRQLPTQLYSSEEDHNDAVALKTTKNQESWPYCRSKLEPSSPNPTVNEAEQLRHPEKIDVDYLLLRNESVLELLDLPRLRPHVLWLYGQNSNVNPAAIRAEKLATTSTCIDGGGVGAGKVVEHVISGASHLLPLERIGACADLLADWMEKIATSYLKM